MRHWPFHGYRGGRNEELAYRDRCLSRTRGLRCWRPYRSHWRWGARRKPVRQEAAAPEFAAHRHGGCPALYLLPRWQRVQQDYEQTCAFLTCDEKDLDVEPKKRRCCKFRIYISDLCRSAACRQHELCGRPGTAIITH